METRSVEQIVFGKLVGADGAILRGLDYQITGRSAGFPLHLEASCHPAHLGLGIEGDAFNWRTYPWFDTGGVVARAFTDPAPYVVVGRVRPRSEEGKATDPRTRGRIYCQAQYAAVRVPEWQYWLPSALGRALEARAMTETRALDPLTVSWDPEERTLPQGWLDLALPHVERLLCGLPVEDVGSSRSVDEFLELVTCCEAALPWALAWRLSFGAGLHTRSSSIRLAMVQVASPSETNCPPVVDEVTSAGARRYVDWLAGSCRSARTFAEVQAIVEERIGWVDESVYSASDFQWRRVAGTMLQKLSRWPRAGWEF